MAIRVIHIIELFLLLKGIHNGFANCQNCDAYYVFLEAVYFIFVITLFFITCLSFC